MKELQSSRSVGRGWIKHHEELSGKARKEQQISASLSHYPKPLRLAGPVIKLGELGGGVGKEKFDADAIAEQVKCVTTSVIHKRDKALRGAVKCQDFCKSI